jgi:hypothetical protein
MHREPSQCRISRSVVALTLLALIGRAGAAGAAQGDCAQPLSPGIGPTASDCLFILGASVGLQSCNPACVCLPSGALPITATDALICLKAAVGQQVELACPCATTTTTVEPIPDVRGTYSGSLDVTTTQCTDPDDNDSFIMSGSVTIDMQVGTEFEGSGIFTVRRFGIPFTLTVPLVGDVMSNGTVDGSYTETFVGQNGFSSSGFGTFTGSLSGNTLMIQLVGQDTDQFGVTCQVLAMFSGN